MKVLGRASISDLLGGFIAYRSLCPMDARLRGLPAAQPGCDPDRPSNGSERMLRVPRKGTEDHARAVAAFLHEAQRLSHDGICKPPVRLLYVGDSSGSDASSFACLCRVTGWVGRALIVAETTQAPKVRSKRVDRNVVLFANRWETVCGFAEQAFADGYGVDQRTVVVVDVDKTLIGARGRNSTPLDRARLEALLHVAREATGGAIDERSLESNLRDLDRSSWHPLTADNQDVVAYLALVTATGGIGIGELRGTERTFASVIADISEWKHRLMPGIRRIHESVAEQVELGSPTPFVAFRQSEYWATRERILVEADGGSADVRLDEEIVMTGEVWQAVRGWQRHGCTVFGLSDKPDEACFPAGGSVSEEALPLHRIRMSIIGGGE